MTKILVCAMAYPPDILGGGEISTRLLAEGLVRLGEDVSVLTFTDGAESQEIISGVKVSRLRCPNVYWSFRSKHQNGFKKIRWHLNQAFSNHTHEKIAQAVSFADPDVVHTSTIEDFGPRFWKHVRSRGTVAIHTLRSHCLLHRSGNMFNAQRDCFLKPDFLSYSKRGFSEYVDGVVGISNDVLSRHLKYGFFPNALTTVIGNPFEGAIEPVVNRSAGAIRVGILGRLEPDKGIEAFLLQLRKWAASTPLPWDVRIAGSGEPSYVDHLRQVAKDLPVEFTGWMETRSFLQSVDLLVIPSRCYEAFGRGVVEANSVGVPVLCLNRGGLPELIAHEKTGWVLEDWSTQGIDIAFRGCRLIDRKEMLAVSEDYTVEAIATKYRSFYLEVLKSNVKYHAAQSPFVSESS